MKNKKFALVLVLLLIAAVLPLQIFASSPTDEILKYHITADVKETAAVNLTYLIEWKVLDSDELGPLSWVEIGIANSAVSDCIPLSDTISDIYYDDNYVYVYLDREYYEGETVEFEFSIIQDYLYQVDQYEDGLTTYSFTPGWFDGIAVDDMTLRWNNENVQSWTPECLVVDGYNTWQTSLEPGGTISVRVNYPNDAYAFNTGYRLNEPDKSGDWEEWDDDWDDDWSGYEYDTGFGFGDFLGGLIGVLMFTLVPIILIVNVAKKAFKATSGLNSGAEKTKTKVTRTKIEYYPVCQGCGAPRGEGETECSHCGRSFIKSEEVISEEELEKSEKEAKKFTTNGEYAYGSSPNTFVRVNVVHVPVTPSRSSSSRSHTGSRSSSSHSSSRSHSSCAHSSCACACASCACACACACAGGGRAGCTVKDFYKTNLKLKQLELKKKAKK